MEPILEICEYSGEGFSPLVDHAAWRVGCLNYMPGLHPDRIDSMERHLETDEVFILVSGRAVLYLGEKGGEIEALHEQVMQPGVVYNVKRGVWHTLVLSREGRLVVVENRDTGRANSEVRPISPELRRRIAAFARRMLPDCWD